MKITAFSALLSVVALGAVAVLALKVDELADEVRLARANRPDAGAPRAEDRNAFAYPDTRQRGVAARGPAEKHAVETVAAPSVDEEADNGPVGTVEERLARLEQDLKRQRSIAPPMFRPQRFVRDLDDLSEQLSLTRSQRDRVQDSLRRGRERIDAIMSVPGADGVSPKQAQEERQKKLQEALATPDKDHGKILQFAMGGRQRLNEKVPGSNETYADQVNRVKRETRDEIKSSLSADQQKTFENTNVDGLVGGNTGTVMSFVTTSTQGGSAEGAVVDGEFGIAVATEDE